MNLPKRNSADGRCYWMKPEVQEELQPLFDQCIQDAIDGKITRLDDSHWPPVVVSSQGAPFEVWQLLRAWTEIQRAETLDAEKAIAFSENLRRQSRWGEIDHHLLDMLKRELQEKYFVATGDEDDRFWDREYSLKPGIRAEQVPEPLLRFACYVAVSYKVYGMDFQYLDTNYLFGLVEKVRPDMVKKLRDHGTGRLPLNLQKRKTDHFTASANDAFAVIRITARDNTEECCHEVLDYLCEILEQEDFPRSYAVEFKGPEKSYLPITGLPKKGVNQLFACAVQYPGLHPLMERYARLAMRQYEQYTNLSDETVVLLSKGEVDSKKIRVEFSLEDMDMSEFQDGATYTQIKDYVLEHSGLKVSNLYISQIKRKCGIEVGKNYNLPKSEDSRQPMCPPEKEKAIREAFKCFGII